MPWLESHRVACVDCKKRFSTNDSKRLRCAKCKVLDRRKRQNGYWAERKDKENKKRRKDWKLRKDVCGRCNKPPVPDKRLCEACQKKQNENYKASRIIRLEKKKQEKIQEELEAKKKFDEYAKKYYEPKEEKKRSKRSRDQSGDNVMTEEQRKKFSERWNELFGTRSK